MAVDHSCMPAGAGPRNVVGPPASLCRWTEACFGRTRFDKPRGGYVVNMAATLLPTTMATIGDSRGEHNMSDETREQFDAAVNMTANELSEWLKTDESKDAGQHKNGGESTGHASGRRIITILNKKKAEITASDEEHMTKVVGYVHRHLAQRPDRDIENSTWRHSLMNWGHDPTK
jgi:hypothetical protein